MNGEDRIYKKLLEHDKRFDQNDKRWEANDKRWEANDKCTDQIIKKLLKHDEQFEQMATSKELQSLKNEVMHSLDQQTIILKHLDEERVFTASWIERVEKEVKRLAEESVRLAKDSVQQGKEIKQVKLRLKIA